MKAKFVFLAITVAVFAGATDAPRPAIPQAPHGGQIVTATTAAKADTKVEEFFYEVVSTGKEVKIYSYLLVPRQVPSFLPVSPKTELTKIVLTTDDKEAKPISYTTTTDAIEAKVDAKLTALRVSAIFKKDVKEARLSLTK